jgi:chromosome segregation ATPase
MKRFLFAAGVIALVLGLAIGQDRGRQDDRRKATKGSGEPPAAGKVQFGGANPGFPGQPDQRGATPFGPGSTTRISPATARRMLPQYEEEVELIEAQRDIRKAHVRAAEVAVKSAETQFELLGNAGNIPQMERAKGRLDVEAARAQLEIKIAEMKEVEVRVKHAKKRVEDAKTAAAAPPPERPGRFDPPPPKNLRNEDRDPADNRPAPAAGLKQQLLDRERVVEERKAKLAEAMVAGADAQAQLVRVREIARQGRVAAAEIEAAEARDQEAQVKVEKARAELKKAQDTLDEARKERDGK